MPRTPRAFRDGEFAIWIGVQDFAPENVYGSGTPPLLYVYVFGKWSGLPARLAEAIEEGGFATLGEVDKRPRNNYAVRHALEKWLPEEIDGYTDRAREQTVEFIDHYARALTELEDLIQQHLK